MPYMTRPQVEGLLRQIGLGELLEVIIQSRAPGCELCTPTPERKAVGYFAGMDDQRGIAIPTYSELKESGQWQPGRIEDYHWVPWETIQEVKKV